MITQTITRSEVEDAIVNADLGLDDVNIRADYSGRGMYGATCFAIDFDSNADMVAFVAAVAHLAGQRGDDVPEWLREVSTDSMGMGIVAYWRRVALED